MCVHLNLDLQQSNLDVYICIEKKERKNKTVNERKEA